MRQLKQNHESATLDVLNHSLGRAWKVAKQVATFGDNGFTSYKRPLEVSNRSGTARVSFFASIEQGYDDARIKQNGIHAQNP